MDKKIYKNIFSSISVITVFQVIVSIVIWGLDLNKIVKIIFSGAFLTILLIILTYIYDKVKN